MVSEIRIVGMSPVLTDRSGEVLADQWRWELDSLNELLQRQESGLGQWYWRIRIRILAFLLARYGREGYVVRPEPRPMDDVRAGEPVRFGPLPRRGLEFRALLLRVSQENIIAHHPYCRACQIVFLANDHVYCTQCGRHLEEGPPVTG